MNQNPLVSLITPGWNGVHFVHRLLDSILNQSYKNIEYIYVDDGSTDGTDKVVLSYEQKFKEQNISFKYVRQENKGLCATINAALQYVNGEFLCWPEYDDVLMVDSVEKKLNFLLKHPDCAVVSSAGMFVKENDVDSVIQGKKKATFMIADRINRFDRDHFVAALWWKSPLTAAHHMVRMDLFDETHPNRTIVLSKLEACVGMLLPLYYKYKRGFIDEPLFYYVVRQSSLSHNVKTLQDHLSKSEEINRVFNRVLDEIPMPAADKEFYKHICFLQLTHRKIALAYKFHNRKLFNASFKILENNNELNRKEKQLNYFSKNILLFYSCERFERLLGIIYKGIRERLLK